MKTRVLVFATFLAACVVAWWGIWMASPLPEVPVKKKYVHLVPKDPGVYTPKQVQADLSRHFKVIQSAQRVINRTVEQLSEKEWYIKLAEARRFAYYFTHDLRDEEGVLHRTFSPYL